MIRKVFLTTGGLVCALALGACYGSTEPATSIGEDSATLNARGTANNGPAVSYFDYWAEGDFAPGGLPLRTPPRSWPAGVSGPVTERVTDLLVASEYSFRFCGGDGGNNLVCAQTRTFRTPTPAGDYVIGGYWASPHGSTPFRLRYSARSGPAGQDAKGTITREDSVETNVWTVKCLAVTANRAIIGVVSATNFPSFFVVQDGPQSGTDLYGGGSAATNPPNCSSVSFDQFPLTQRDPSALTVRDAS